SSVAPAILSPACNCRRNRRRSRSGARPTAGAVRSGGRRSTNLGASVAPAILSPASIGRRNRLPYLASDVREGGDDQGVGEVDQERADDRDDQEGLGGGAELLHQFFH